MKIVTALLNPDDVMTAVRRLTTHDFTYDDLALISSASEVPDYLAAEPEESAAAGAAAGAASGVTIGTLGTAVAATIPGFEAVVVSGMMATALGGVIGGYLGSLYAVRADGETEINVREALVDGQLLIVVRCDHDEAVETAVSLLAHNSGQYIDTHTISSAKFESYQNKY